VAGLGLLTGLVGFTLALSANALLDRSPAEFRPAQIDEMVMVTHNLIFREYEIKYHFTDGDPKRRDYLSTPFEMGQFQGDFAAAEVHAGRFGWPWVKALRSIQFAPPGQQPRAAE
jgi:hypothetical protein